MHLTTILVALSAALASGAAIERPETANPLSKRNCYSSGEGWGGQVDNALQELENFCNVKPASFNEGQGFGRCYNLGSGKRVNFELGNISGGSRSIDYAECYDGFQKEINGCPRGGRTGYANWHYK